MEVRGCKFSKNDRRVYKKQMKLKETLFRHEKLACSVTPSKHIVVANGGLGNGIEREQLWSYFEKFGDLVDVVMKPRKPYAFISFATVDDAVTALEAVNGHRLDNANPESPFLYLLYVNEYDNSSSYLGGDELPSGLVILTNFISPDEELELLSSLDWDHAQESLKHRRVLHYGYRFMYDSNDVNREPLTDKIPASCSQLINRLLESSLISNCPDQLTVNQYLPGQGIPPHVDTHSAFEDTIIIVNLQSQITMEFRNGDRHISAVFPRLSVVLMSGEARYQWTHAITPRTMDIVPIDTNTCTRLTLFKRGIRTSLTFRTVRQSGFCNCVYRDQCDSQFNKRCNQVSKSLNAENVSLPTDDNVLLKKDKMSASQLESDYVHKVYETIATHFSDTRHTPWPRVAAFINQLPDGAIVADIGCGNGKYLGINRHIFTVGCDRSQSLCEICRERGYESLICDSLDIPLRDGSCDAVLCIAVIHHMSTTIRRQKAVAELVRVLRAGGQALIYVWALEQERDKVRSKYLKSSKDNCCGKVSAETSLPVHVNRTAFEAQDIFVPWHLKKPKDSNKLECSSVETSSEKVLHRYYHTFVEGELEQLCRTVENVNVIDSYYDQGNWCVILARVV